MDDSCVYAGFTSNTIFPLKCMAMWTWAALTFHSTAVFCAICVVVTTSVLIAASSWPPQPAPTYATAATAPGPITSLPAELLVEVLANLNPGRPAFDDLYTAMRVCSTWRRTARNAPRLWCVIEGAHRMSAIKFDAYLSRSKTVPLAVTLGRKTSKMHIALLIPHMYRLRALHLGPLAPSDTLARLLCCPAPALQLFYIGVSDGTAGTWRIPHALFACQAPKLKKLHADPRQLPDVGACMALSRIEYFHTVSQETTLESVAKVLRACPALRVLRVSAASASTSWPNFKVPSGLGRLHISSTSWTHTRRAGLVQMLDMLPVPVTWISHADAATIRHAVLSTVTGASMKAMAYMRTTTGGRVILASEDGSTRHAFLDVPSVEFRKSIHDPLLFARILLLEMPGILPETDLPLPPMPQLASLRVIFTSEYRDDSKGDNLKCIFALAGSRAMFSPLPALRELYVLFRPYFGVVLSVDPVPSSTIKPFVTTGDLACLVQQVLIFGSSQCRLERLTVSPCLQVKEPGGVVFAKHWELMRLVDEFCHDEEHDPLTLHY